MARSSVRSASTPTRVGSMVHAFERCSQRRVAGTDLDGQRTLCRGREDEVERQTRMSGNCDAKPIQAGRGKHQAVEFPCIQPAEP